MDLISRKSVAEKMAQRRDYVGRPSDPDCIIADEPSVPAVPLDKLCEWLDKYNVTVPCIDDCEGCEAFDGTGDTVNCWKVILAKWMEEQDESD